MEVVVVEEPVVEVLLAGDAVLDVDGLAEVVVDEDGVEDVHAAENYRPSAPVVAVSVKAVYAIIPPLSFLSLVTKRRFAPLALVAGLSLLTASCTSASSPVETRHATITTSPVIVTAPMGLPYEGVKVPGTSVLIPPNAGTAVGACGLDSYGEGPPVATGPFSYRCADPKAPIPVWGQRRGVICLPSHAAITVSTGTTSTFSSGEGVTFRTRATNLSSLRCGVDIDFVGIYIYAEKTGQLMWDNWGPLDGTYDDLPIPAPFHVRPGQSVSAVFYPTNRRSYAVVWDQHGCVYGDCEHGAQVPAGKYDGVVMWAQLGGVETTITITGTGTS